MAKTLATRMAFGQEIIEIAKTNENFVVCNADTKTCGLEKFGKYFPEREFSFGIAEQNLVAASAGMAACGNKVFLATFAVFASMRACEQVLAHAAVDFTGPLYVRLHRNPVADLYDPATYKFEWGKANTVVDNGSDMTMIVSGILLKKALDAAAILKEQGIGVRVLAMATIKPLDKEAVLKAAGETGAIMTIEDHSIFGGLGSAVAEVVVVHIGIFLHFTGITGLTANDHQDTLRIRRHRKGYRIGFVLRPHGDRGHPGPLW